jgi:hypothetical protein
MPARRVLLLRALAVTVVCGLLLPLVHLEALRGHSHFTTRGLLLVGIPYVLILLGLAGLAVASPVVSVSEAGIRVSTPWLDFLERSGRPATKVTLILWPEIERLELSLRLLRSKDVLVGFEIISCRGRAWVGTRYPHAAEILEALQARRAELAMDVATRDVLGAFLRSRSTWVVETLLRRALLAFAQGRGLCKVYWTRGWFERIRKSSELRADFLASLSACLSASGAPRGEREHNEAP